MKNFTPLILLLCLAAPTPTAAQVNYDTVQVRIEHVSESVYVLYGRGGNVGVSIGSDGAFIIDDQFEALSDKIIEAVASIAGDPIQFAVNTHWHYDHTDGNKTLGRDGVIIIAQENSRTRLLTDQVLSVSRYEQAAYPEHGLPKITFDHGMTLHYNGDTVHIFHVENAHTDGDAIVYFEKANVFHMGDVFVTYGFPFIDDENGGDIDGIITACQKVISMSDDETWFIPGHGTMSRRADVVAFVAMLGILRMRVADLVDEGKSLDEIVALRPADGINGISEERANADAAVTWVYKGVVN